MKTSLKKLRGFGLHHRHDLKSKRELPPCPLDELVKASQDMQDMRDCYDSLLSAAAATTNSAYEFSESLREMGSCLLEKTALSNDEESGRVLLMLGKVQFELQKLIDSYRSHIVQTITIPSESLLNELRTVEEMKQQCDEKRNAYECMITKQRDKGRTKSTKGESISFEQLQAAHDDYDEEATLFVFRLKSLKQGQSRSLLTQAARHHAAQLSFFRKALRSLEAVEPHVKTVTEQQHIDYHFTGLEEDDGEDGDEEGDDNYDDDDGFGTIDGGELSFDYGQSTQMQDAISNSRNLMEFEQGELTFPQITPMESVKENLGKRRGDSEVFGKDFKLSSQSAPLFPERKSDPGETMGQTQPSSRRKFHAYVLPTPDDAKNSISNSVPQTNIQNMWHSSPLEAKKQALNFGDKSFSRHSVSSATSKDSNSSFTSTQLPPPLVERRSLPQLQKSSNSYSKKLKRHAFSGPLPGSKLASSISSPISSMGQAKLFSGPPLLNLTPKPSLSPKVSPSASPSFVSSPKISELHELPRPPATSTTYAKPLGSLVHSAPLLSSGNFLSTTNKVVAPNTASPLPTPSQALSRSFSIPSSSQRVVAFQVSRPLDSPQNLAKVETIASPPLTPISLPTQLTSIAVTSHLGL